LNGVRNKHAETEGMAKQIVALRNEEQGENK